MAATASFIVQDLVLALYRPRHMDGALRTKLDHDGLENWPLISATCDIVLGTVCV